MSTPTAEPTPLTRNFEIPKRAISVVIGPRGATIQRTQRTSGAKAAVDVKTSCVNLTANSAESLDEAERQIRKQVANIEGGVASGFEHPVSAVVQLDPEFRNGCQFSVHSTGKYALSAFSDVTSVDSRTDSTPSSERVFFSPGETDQVFQRFALQGCRVISSAALGEGGGHQGAVRFGFGKQLFYDAPKGNKIPLETPIPLSTLCGWRVGFDKDLKAEFENGISPATADRLRSRLADMGFSLVRKKDSLSCHAFDMEEQSGLLCRFVPQPSLDPEAGGDLLFHVERVKTAKQRLCFVTFLRGAAANEDKLDFRFKLLSHSDSKLEMEVRRDVPSVLWNDSSCQATFVHAPMNMERRPPYGDRFLLEAARRKTKDVYEGTFQNRRFRVALSSVQQQGGTHLEATGSNLDWNLNPAKVFEENKTWDDAQLYMRRMFADSTAFCKHLLS